MTKKVIMIKAWDLAYAGAKRFGGKASDYISEAMKWSWMMYKKLRDKKGGRIAGVAEWFLKKTFGHPSVVTQINSGALIVIKETKKALYIEAPIVVDDRVISSNKFWAPKSVCI